jgi:cytochrome c oxidase subunit 3
MQHSDHTGSKLGMWLFLYTELMLFGGLFVAYAYYYYGYSADFITAGKALDVFIGTTNTVILLISSFAVAASITAIRRGSRAASMVLLGVTLALGLAFLVNKYFEWGHKIEEGIYPGAPALLDGPPGETIFFGLYYTITGLHGLHVLIGVIVLAICLVLVARGRIRTGHDIVLENSALYWHLVDLIWIFVFPLFYLIL